jgi:ABC-type amino acid transport substrate-binding protein
VSGRVDYVIADYLNGLFLLRVMGLQAQVHAYADRPIKHTQYYAMFSRHTVDRGFVERFDAALRTFQQSERYRTLIRVAMGEAAGPTPAP